MGHCLASTARKVDPSYGIAISIELGRRVGPARVSGIRLEPGVRSLGLRESFGFTRRITRDVPAVRLRAIGVPATVPVLAALVLVIRPT